MIYRGPGLLAVVITPHPPPPQSTYILCAPPPPVSKLDRRHTGTLRKRDNLLTVEGGRRWGRAQIIRQRKKAWAAINHSILSGDVYIANL